MNYSQQIGKAAKMLDLNGDVAGAVAVLEAVLKHPGIESAVAEKIEAMTFLADLHCEIGALEEARRYLANVEAIDVTSIEPDLVQHHLDRVRELKAELSDE